MIVDEENIKNEDENNDSNSTDKTMSDKALTEVQNLFKEIHQNLLHCLMN